MYEILSSWAWGLGRVTLVLAVVALIVGVVLRFTRPTSPRLHRTLWCLVLLVGWLFVRLPVSVPWYESTVPEEKVVAVKTPEKTVAPVPTPDLATGSLATDNEDDLIEIGPPVSASMKAKESGEVSPHSKTHASVETSGAPLASIAKRSASPSSGQATDTKAASPVAATSRSGSPLDTSLSLARSPATPSFSRRTLSGVILAVWLLGMLVALLRWLSGYIRSLRSMSTALEPDEATARQWQELLRRHKIDREIPLRLTKSMGPLLCRWPDGYELVVPTDFWASLSPSARLSVMRHELAHYERGDVWKSLAMRVLALPHWFNPAAWWAVRRFDEAAEWACDEAALGDTKERSTDYARTLLVLAESSLGGGSCHPSMSRLSLPARIRRLVSSSNRKDSLMKKITLLSVALLLLTFCLVRIDLVAKAPAVKESKTVEVAVTPKAEPTSSTKPDPATSKTFRYQGKTFDEWKEILATETSTARLCEAIEAFAAIGARGDSQRAADEILKLMRTYGTRVLDSDQRSADSTITRKAIAAFIGMEQELDGWREVPNAIPPKTGILALCCELEKGNEKSQGFVLCVFERMFDTILSDPGAFARLEHPLYTDGPETEAASEQVSLALAKFAKSDATLNLKRGALSLLARRDSNKFSKSLFEAIEREKEPGNVFDLLYSTWNFRSGLVSTRSAKDGPLELKLNASTQTVLSLLAKHFESACLDKDQKLQSLKKDDLQKISLYHLKTLAQLQETMNLSNDGRGKSQAPLTLSAETSQLLKELVWQTIRSDSSLSAKETDLLKGMSERHPYHALSQNPDFVAFIDEATQSKDESLSKPAKRILAEMKQIEEAAKKQQKSPDNRSASRQKTTTPQTTSITKKSKQTPDRAKLRYQGKSFDEWKEILATDLSVATRADAIKALAAFGSRGYGKESADIIARLMREYGGITIDGSDRTRLLETAIAAFYSEAGQEKPMLDTIPLADGVPVLCRELKEGNHKSRCFALYTLINMGPKAKDAVPALAEFIRSYKKTSDEKKDSWDLRDGAFGILKNADPTGETTAAVLREEFAKNPAEYPAMGVIGLSDMMNPIVSPDISPGERAVALVVSEHVDGDRPQVVRESAMYNLACFLANFDTKDNSIPGTGGMGSSSSVPRPLSEETLQFGQEMMERLVPAFEKASPKEQDHILRVMPRGIQRYQSGNVAIETRPRVYDMALRVWEKAQKAASEKPGDVDLAKKEKAAKNFYKKLTGEDPDPKKAEEENTKKAAKKTTKAKSKPEMEIWPGWEFGPLSSIGDKNSLVIVAVNKSKTPQTQVKVEFTTNEAVEITACSKGYVKKDRRITWTIDSLPPRATKRFMVKIKNVLGGEKVHLRLKATSAEGAEAVNGGDYYTIDSPELPAEELVPVTPEATQDPPLNSKPDQGVTHMEATHTLVYTIEAARDAVDMEKLIAAVEQRLRLVHPKCKVSTKDGLLTVTFTSANDEVVEQINRLLLAKGTLEFRILANRHDHKELIERAGSVPKTRHLFNQGKLLGWWVPVLDREAEPFTSDNQIITRKVQRDGKAVLEVLVVNDPYNVTNKFLVTAEAKLDSLEKNCIRFSLNKAGGQKFYQLTSENQPLNDGRLNLKRRLGIILDGTLYSAPFINSRISTDAEISGNFTKLEAEELAHLLKLGPLPAPLTAKMMSSTSPSTTQTEKAYRIEPPDLLEIKITSKIVPKGAYLLKKGDTVRINVLGGIPGLRVQDRYTIDDRGSIDFPLVFKGEKPQKENDPETVQIEYLEIKLRGLSVDDAAEAVRKRLEKILDRPKVSLELICAADFKLSKDDRHVLYLVGPDGTVNLGKTYGSVNVAGKTVEEAKKAIEKQLGTELNHPVVSVQVAAENSKVYYIILGKTLDDQGHPTFSEVMTMPFSAEEKKTVSDALRFKGWEDDLKKASIWIARPSQNRGGKETKLPVDYEAIATDRDTKTNYPILAGDRIYVEQIPK